MKTMKNLGVAALVAGAVLIPAGGASDTATAATPSTYAPSDHDTYRWHGLRCVKPGAPEGDSTSASACATAA